MGYVESRLRSLQDQHRRLDEQIKSLTQTHADDQLVKKAKMEKLRLKEEIETIKNDNARNSN